MPAAEVSTVTGMYSASGVEDVSPHVVETVAPAAETRDSSLAGLHKLQMQWVEL